ncbi:hypothetical protein HWI79_287 [Cryptosporidium felis]|nr:hypothetical protein HWI79_287 [Cryptosporidium felis]
MAMTQLELNKGTENQVEFNIVPNVQRYAEFERSSFQVCSPHTFPYPLGYPGRQYCCKVTQTAEGPNLGVSSNEPTIFNLRINRTIAALKTQEELLMLFQTYIDHFNGTNIANLLHRLATLFQDSGSRGKVRRDYRFMLLVERAVFCSSYSSSYCPKDLANIAWSLVKFGMYGHMLFDLIGSESVFQLERFASINLSIILWSFAKAGRFNKNLFLYAIPRVLSELPNMEPQQISNIAWSYSKVGLVSPHLFENLKKRSIMTIDQFLPIHISMLCYAFSMAEIFPPDLFKLVSEMEVDSFAPKAVAHICWSFSLGGLEIPKRWLGWIHDNDNLISLSFHELSLLITAISLYFIEGSVLVRQANPNEFGYLNTNYTQKLDISKALGIRDRDPGNCVIEWDKSYHSLKLVTNKPSCCEESFNSRDFLWKTIDLLIPRLFEKTREFREAFDVVGILTFIGKDVSLFLTTFNERLLKNPKPQTKFFRELHSYSNSSEGSTCLNQSSSSREATPSSTSGNTENWSINSSPSTHKSSNTEQLSLLTKSPSKADNLFSNELFPIQRYNPLNAHAKPSPNKISNFSTFTLLIYNLLLMYLALSR